MFFDHVFSSGIGSCYKNCDLTLNSRVGTTWANVSGLFHNGYWYKRRQDYYYMVKNMKILQAGKVGLQLYGSHYSPYDDILHNPIKLWNTYYYGMAEKFVYLFDVSAYTV